MSWQMFPVFIIKGVLSAAVIVGIVGSILTGFLLVVNYIGDTYGLGWGFLSFLCGVVFIILSIAFTIEYMDQYQERQSNNV